MKEETKQIIEVSLEMIIHVVGETGDSELFENVRCSINHILETLHKESNQS